MDTDCKKAQFIFFSSSPTPFPLINIVKIG